MPVIPKNGGPYSLFCTDCLVWVANTANVEMRKEGFYAHSHICGRFDSLFEARDTDWQKKKRAERQDE